MVNFLGVLYFADLALDHNVEVEFDEFEGFVGIALVHEIEPDCLEAASQSDNLDVLA